jgi:DNA-binding HxlR family transcriptional regulator
LERAHLIDLEGIDGSLHEGLVALATAMRANGYQRDDPVREIFAVLGDRWSTLILLTLNIGTFRHAELLRAIAGLSAGSEGKISQRVLTQKLRLLERDGLVDRSVTHTIPPRVSYTLTATGRALVGHIAQLQDWIFGNRLHIDAARAAFDLRQNEPLP